MYCSYITRAEFLGDGSSSSSLRSDMIEKAEMAFNLMDRYLLFKVTVLQKCFNLFIILLCSQIASSHC